MKKLFLTFLKLPVVFVLVVVTFWFTGCKKDTPAAPTTTTGASIAQPLDDLSTAGVYMGVLAGNHSGNFVLLVDNGDNNVKAIISYNNIQDTLSTQDLLGWQPGENATATFSGAYGNGMFLLHVNITKNTQTNAIVFTATASNTAESSDSVIMVAGMKELSTLIVNVYEGTFTGADQGITFQGKWNFVMRSTQLTGVINDNTNRHTGTLTGQNGSGTWSINNDSGPFAYSTTGNYINGSWNGTTSANGTYQVQQTN